MTHATIAIILLLLIIATTGPVGVVPMSIGILAMYGLTREIARREKLSRGTERAAMFAARVYAVAMLAFLVYLWSFKLDLSLPVGGAIWVGTIALLEHGLQIAERWSQRQNASAGLVSLVDDRQAA